MAGRVRNRVWDVSVSKHVTWDTEHPDNFGYAYPGPGNFDNDGSGYCVTLGTASVDDDASLLHGRFGPLLLTQLDKDLTSISGSNFAVDTGTEQYLTGPVPDTSGSLFDGATILAHASHDSELLLTSSITLQALVWLSSSGVGGGFRDIAEFTGGPADDEPNNAIWQMGSNNGSPFYAHEYGAGINQTFTWTGTSLPTNKWFHMAIVRDQPNKNVKLYIDGELDPVEYNYTNDPTGGSTSKAAIGGFWAANIQFWIGRISSVKLIARKLSHAEIMAEYKTWLDPTDR